jgi:uncharacterized membrane protein
VGWLGAVLVIIALASIGLSSQEERTVRGAYPSPLVHSILAVVLLTVATALATLR